MSTGFAYYTSPNGHNQKPVGLYTPTETDAKSSPQYHGNISDPTNGEIWFKMKSREMSPPKLYGDPYENPYALHPGYKSSTREIPIPEIPSRVRRDMVILNEPIYAKPSRFKITKTPSVSKKWLYIKQGNTKDKKGLLKNLGVDVHGVGYSARRPSLLRTKKYKRILKNRKKTITKYNRLRVNRKYTHKVCRHNNKSRKPCNKQNEKN